MFMAPRVLLINPPIYDFAAYDLFNKPLGLLYLGSFLKKAGYQVRLIDALDRHSAYLDGRCDVPKVKANGTGKYYSQVVEKPECVQHVERFYRRYGLGREMLAEALERENREHRCIAVGLTSMMTYWYPGVADTSKLVREIMPDVPIALGGVYATLMPEHARRVCQYDALFVGAGQWKMLQWLDGLARIKRDYKKSHLEFGAWPCPAYELYGQLDYLTLMTSLGCPFRCEYCASGLLQGRLMQLGPEQFVTQLLKLLPLLDYQDQVANIALMDDALLARAQSHIIPILQRIAELDLPLRFHCPNGLHVRFITPEVAKLMRQNNFEMIRLSYESASAVSMAQQVSDGKVSDRYFRRAIKNLEKAGFSREQLEAYILTGLPGQEMTEIEQSAQTVHELGVQVRLCQFSPIRGTGLFETACREYGLDPHEPLLHNNSILPALDKRVSLNTFQQFKNHIAELNRSSEDD